MLRSSFDEHRNKQPYIIPYENGFVSGLIRAFNQDLHLVIRPDDVWLAILLQFSNYVNGHAEDLRHLFVAHDGQKQLILDFGLRPFAKIETSEITDGFVSLIHQNVVDETLRGWMLPAFSTSTENDRQVASLTMMGTLKQYFEYIMAFGCGLPSVTLLGDRQDWEEILHRLAKFAHYGSEPAQWADRLRPVLKNMLLTFDEPESEQVKQFWLHVVQEEGQAGSGRGDKTLSGWITAFTFWDQDGKRTHEISDSELESLACSDRQTYNPSGHAKEAKGDYMERLRSSIERKRLVLDGVTYPFISPSSIPSGVVTVPIKLKDKRFPSLITTTMLVGSVGMSLSADRTTVQPLSGWWMALNYEHPDNKDLDRDE